MEKDFDYVTMDDYQTDMKESADHAVAAITLANERAHTMEVVLGLIIIGAGGSCRISQFDLAKLWRRGEPQIEFEREVDMATGDLIMRARWKLPK